MKALFLQNSTLLIVHRVSYVIFFAVDVMEYALILFTKIRKVGLKLY